MAVIKYLAVAVLAIVFFSAEVESSCVSCSTFSAYSNCDDPYTPRGPMNEVCSKIDHKLCSKYGTGYRILCGFPLGTTHNCTYTRIQCAICKSCRIGANPCSDPYTPTGQHLSQQCAKINQTLFNKYGGGYEIQCTEGGIDYKCTTQSSSSSSSSSDCTGSGCSTGTHFTSSLVGIILSALCIYVFKSKL